MGLLQQVEAMDSRVVNATCLRKDGVFLSDDLQCWSRVTDCNLALWRHRLTAEQDGVLRCTNAMMITSEGSELSQM